MMLFVFVDGLLFSFLSIFVVLSIIGLVVLSIYPLKKLTDKQLPSEKIQKQEKLQKFDDDMMVALLVASIDFRETEKKEPKLVAIKELKNENL